MAVRCCSLSGGGVLFPCKHGGESLTIMLTHLTPLVAFSNEKGTLCGEYSGGIHGCYYSTWNNVIFFQ